MSRIIRKEDLTNFFFIYEARKKVIKLCKRELVSWLHSSLFSDIKEEFVTNTINSYTLSFIGLTTETKHTG